MIEDQFDFHTYCLRKMTLRAYIELLRCEDTIYKHKVFFFIIIVIMCVSVSVCERECVCYIAYDELLRCKGTIYMQKITFLFREFSE